MATTRERPALWGRLVESAVGAHLVNSVTNSATEVTYWRERDQEVDFVVRTGSSLTAIEVKSGRHSVEVTGLARFRRAFPEARTLIVGSGGIALEEFLAAPTESWTR